MSEHVEEGERVLDHHTAKRRSRIIPLERGEAHGYFELELGRRRRHGRHECVRKRLARFFKEPMEQLLLSLDGVLVDVGQLTRPIERRSEAEQVPRRLAFVARVRHRVGPVSGERRGLHRFVRE